MSCSGPVSGWTASKSINQPMGSSKLTIVGTNTVTYAPLGADSNLNASMPFTYVPAGSRYNFIISLLQPAADDTEFMVMYERWIAPGEAVYAGSINGVILAGNYGAKDVNAAVAGVNMWIRPTHVSMQGVALAIWGQATCQLAVASGAGAGVIAYIPSAVSAGEIILTPTAVQTLLPLVIPAEYANSTLPWQTTRTTACAMLGTNVSQVLNKAGTVMAGRVSPSVQDPFNVTQSYISTLHPAEKAFLALETGVYSYAPPSTDLAHFWDYSSVVGVAAATQYAAVAPLPMYHLGNDSLVNVMFITAGSVAESLACTVDWHIEFRTSSALFQIGLSTIPIEVLHTAQISLASVGYFFENVQHKKLLGQVVNATKAYANAMVSSAGAKAKNKKGGNGNASFSAKPGKNMAATSGRASGIVSGSVRGSGSKKKDKKNQKNSNKQKR